MIVLHYPPTFVRATHLVLGVPCYIVIWVDDEEDICTHPELNRLYSLSPDSYFGLTNEEMRKIDSL